MALVKSTNVSMSYATNRFNTIDENCFINKLPTSSQNTCSAAYSNRLVRAAYDGPLVQVRRGSDNALLDFYGDTNGLLTTRPFGAGTALHAWLNGATGYVARLYDQSGFEKHIGNSYIASNTSFPVSGLTGFVTNVSGAVGGGVYVVSSSGHDNFPPWKAFDNDLNSHTRSTEGVYAITTGLYTGTASTVTISGTSYSGEWLQIQLPVGIKLSRFDLVPRGDYATTRSPRSFVLLGSTTGSSWNLIHEETNQNNWSSVSGNGVTKQFTVTSSPAAYKYYRLVVRRVGNFDNDTTFGGGNQVSFSLADFKLYGGNTDTQPTIGTGIFPPMPMTANTTSVNDSTLTYGGGTYVASASTEFSGNSAWKAFDYNDSNDFGVWHSAENGNLIYNGTTGQYAGSVTTTSLTGTVYSGEWIQLQLPQRIQLTSFSIFPRNASLELAQKRSPRSFVILGSNNGTDWTLLDEETNTNDWTQIAKVFTVTPSSTAYNYFRMVVRRVGNFDSSTSQTSVNILHWMLYGNNEACTDIVYNGSTNYLTTDYGIQTYPPQAMTANSTAFTTAEFDNGSYVASASTEYGVGTESWRAFDYKHLSTDLGWSSSAVWNTTTGSYSGSVTTTSLTNQVYIGEWLQLQLPNAIALTHFTIVPRTEDSVTASTRSPRSFVVLGSNNGSSWSLVHEETNINTWTNAGKTFFVRQATSSYSYYRMVIRRLGNNDTTPPKGTADIASWFLHSSKLPVSVDPVERLYPPSAMSSNSTAISGLTYTASASAVLNNDNTYAAWKAFDVNDSTFWHTDGIYNSTSGVYAGSVVTRTTNGTSYVGEWIQILLPLPVILSYFVILGRSGFETTRSPRSFVVLGSNDGLSWNLVHEETNVNDWAIGVSRLFNVDATIKPASYAYFRIVTRRVGNVDSGSGQDSVQISTMQLYGFRGAQKTTVFTDLKALSVASTITPFEQRADTTVGNGSFGLASGSTIYYFGWANDVTGPQSIVNYRRKLVLDVDHTLSSNNVVCCDNGTFYGATSGTPSAHSVGFHAFDVGGVSQINSYYFNGVINELVFFNESLQQSDILTYYQPTAKRAITNYTLKPKTTVRGVLGLPIASQADGNTNSTRYFIPTDWKFAIDTQHLGSVTTGTPLRTWNTATAFNSPVYYISGGNQDFPYVNFTRGSSQYLNAGSTTFNINSNGGFTAVAFVKFVNIGSTGLAQRLFDFGNGQSNNNIVVHLNEGADKSVSFYIFEANGSNGVVSSPNNTIVEGEWAVWAFTYTASTKVAQIYKNGSLLASSSAFTTTPANRTLTNSYIGWSNWSGENTTNMHLAGLYMYDRNLSLAEMAAIGNHLIMPVRKSISSLQDLSVVKANRAALPLGRQLGEPAMFFDGSALNWITVDDAPKQPFSFNFWFNASSSASTTNMALAALGSTNKATSNGIEIRYSTVTTNITIYAAISTAWSTLTFNTVASNTWHHLTITVSAGNVLNAYLNGGGKQTITGTGPISGLSRFYLGTTGNDGVDVGTNLKGYIQDFRVYDYVLRDDEVANVTNYPILNSISSESGKYLVNRTNWYRKMTLTQSQGAYTAEQTFIDPDVQVQLTNSTSNVNSYSQNFRIQDYRSFTCRFEIYNNSAVADAIYFFCGSNLLPLDENSPNSGIIVAFDVYTDGGVKGVSIINSSGQNVAYHPWTYWVNSGSSGTTENGTHVWMPITITYTRGLVNTWTICMGEREILNYSDPNNDNWLTTSGDLWGIGARTGTSTMNSWIRGVELVYNEPRYQNLSLSSAIAGNQLMSFPNGHLYNNSLVQSGLAAYFDPGNTSCYPGTGTTLRSLVGSITGTLGGTYSYSNGTIRLTNTSGTDTSNTSHLQLSSISNIRTVSIWYYQHTSATPTGAYLLDGRTGVTESFLSAGAMGTVWSNGTLYKNGGSAQSLTWGNIQTTGVWQNITVIANQNITDDMTLFARFQNSQTSAPPPVQGLDVTFGPIFVYNRVLTEAENLQNYNAIKDTLGSPYNAKASTFILNTTSLDYNAGKAFDKDITTIWSSAEPIYNSTTGAYTGSVTTNAGGTTYSGEWIQTCLNNAIRLKSYTITPRQTVDYARTSPRSFVVLGSNDESTWTLIDEQTSITNWYYSAKTFNVTRTPSSFAYYRLVARQVGNLTSGGTSQRCVTLAGWELHAFPNTATIAPLIAEYPPIALSSTSASVSGQNYGNGVYISSASSNNGNPASNAFNKTNVDGNDGWHSADGTISASTPQWIQIQVPQPTIVTSYSITSRVATTYVNYPTQWRLQGSNNGSTWVDLETNRSESTWASNTTKTFSSNINTSNLSFVYFRLLIEASSRNGTGVEDNRWAAIGEWRLYGNERSTALTGTKYPIAPLNNEYTIVPGSGVGCGEYIATASSNAGINELPSLAFNNNFTDFWTCGPGYYSNGVYQVNTTTTVDGVSRVGEWLQLQLPNPISLTSYSLYQNSVRGPKDFFVAGSNNGSTWELVDSETNVTGWTTAAKSFTTTNTKRFSYYRLIINSCNGDNYASITEWNLYDSTISMRSIAGKSARGLVDGLTWKFANGYHSSSATYFDTTPYTQIGRSSDFTNLASATNGRFTSAQTMDSYSIEWTGYFRAPETGTFTFFLNTDDQSYLWIGTTALAGYTTSNTLVTDTANSASTYATITLTAGVYYPIRLLWGESSSSQSLAFGFTTPSGVTVTDGSGYFFSSVGTNAAYPAESAKIIKSLTSTNTDGVYYINVNGVSEPTYCLMNDRYDGGGWMMLMKATRGTTFVYEANYWTTANTLNATDLTRTDADAKYNAFNYKPIKDILAIWPDISPSAYTNNFSNQGGSFYVEDGWVWEITNWNGASMATALAGFQSSRIITPQDPREFNGYSTAWSAQSTIQAHVINNGGLTLNNGTMLIRWGFVWNNEANYTSCDAFGGIGLGLVDSPYPYYSAGDFTTVPGNAALSNTGINRSARVEMFGR